MTVAKNRTTAPAATWSDEDHFRFDINNSWRSEVEQFFDAIEHDRPVQTGTPEDALKLMRIIERIYENGHR